MKIHHIGYTVENLQQSLKAFLLLGYRVCEDVCEDAERDVDICFVRDSANNCVELVAPRSSGSPVSSWLKKNGSSPYHLCYESDDFEADIDRLRGQGFLLCSPASPAAAMGSRRVAFLYAPQVGLMEILESTPGESL